MIPASERYKEYVGKVLADLPPGLADSSRVLWPGTPVQADFDMSRVNIVLDKTGKIIGIMSG
jgi:hypothetical protein